MVRRTRAKRSRSAGISPDATAALLWRGRCLATRRRRRSRRKSGVLARQFGSTPSPRREFSWPAVPDAKFVVSVVAGDDVVARSGTLDRNRWTPEQPLTRGRAYAWQVRVIRGAGVETLPAPPRPNPRFRVIGDDEA